MYVELENILTPLHKGLFAKGKIEFNEGVIVHLVGENGIGKSSLLHTFKLNQDNLFSQFKCQFINQKRIESVNNISVKDFFYQMNCFQTKELPFFQNHHNEIVNLNDIPLNSLSGGQNQFVKILLSAYLGGDIFFFDEPLLSLDHRHKNLYFEFLEELVILNKRVFIIEHANFDFKTLPVKQYSMKREQDALWIS